jgi:hypothetical protein
MPLISVSYANLANGLAFFVAPCLGGNCIFGLNEAAKMKMRREMKVGIIGCGHVSKAHIPIYFA